jgi:hypothetical protein
MVPEWPFGQCGDESGVVIVLIDGAGPPLTTDPGAGRTPSPGRGWRWRLGAAATVAAAAVLVGGLVFAATYQPVGFGGSFRGPVGAGLISRQVNTTGFMQGQWYLPPQPPADGSFYISLDNTGPFAVTIESVSLLPPGMPASAINYGRPFRIIGEPTYTAEYVIPGQPNPGPRRLDGAVLQPGQSVNVEIPIRTARCWIPQSSLMINSVWVTTESLLWTHQVAISWTDPDDSSQGAIISPEGFAAPRDAPRLVCPK